MFDVRPASVRSNCELMKNENLGTSPTLSKGVTGDSLITIRLGRGYCPDAFRTITSYCPEGFWTLTSYCTEPLSNVRKCWLAIPLGAGSLSWVLAWHTIERKISFFV